MSRQTHDRAGRELRSQTLLTFAWETVPEIAFRLRRPVAETAERVLEAVRNGRAQGGYLKSYCGWQVPAFKASTPLFDEVSK